MKGIVWAGIALLFVLSVAACGESGTNHGLIARWHGYAQMFMYSTEIVRTERLLGDRYRLDVSGHPLHSMDSPASSAPLYLNRETPIDSLEVHPVPVLLVDPPGKRIVTFQPVSETEVYYESYPYDLRAWREAPAPGNTVSQIDSLGIDKVAGYEARHYRLAVEDDSLASVFRRMGQGFPAQMIVDLWLAGPDALLDEYFSASKTIPDTEWDYDRKTLEPETVFRKRGDDDAERAIRSKFHEAGHVVRTETRIEFHGVGVGASIPPEMDPVRLAAGEVAADTVRSILIARDALAALSRAPLREGDFGLPATAQSKEEWKRKMSGGKSR